MTQAEFQLFVKRNEVSFAGVNPETSASVGEVEKQIGCLLPPSLKWLLIAKGYSTPCGIDALDESATATLRARQALQLPERYIILNDWQDSGVVFFDAATINFAGEYKIYWAGAHNLNRLAEGQEMDNDAHTFEDFPDWVRFRLEENDEQN